MHYLYRSTRLPILGPKAESTIGGGVHLLSLPGLSLPYPQERLLCVAHKNTLSDFLVQGWGRVFPFGAFFCSGSRSLARVNPPSVCGPNVRAGPIRCNISPRWNGKLRSARNIAKQTFCPGGTESVVRIAPTRQEKLRL